MRLRYLQTAEIGLKWMRNYYRKNPQLDRNTVSLAMKRAEETLVSFPNSGERYEAFGNVWEYHIQGSPFSFLYTVADDCVWIIDIRDCRGNRSAEVLREFVREIRRRNGL